VPLSGKGYHVLRGGENEKVKLYATSHKGPEQGTSGQVRNCKRSQKKEGTDSLQKKNEVMVIRSALGGRTVSVRRPMPPGKANNSSCSNNEIMARERGTAVK